MTDDIDLAAVVESLQHDNELLRLRLYQLRTAQSPLDMIDANAVKAWLLRNYALIAVIVPLALLLLSFVDTVVRITTHKKGDS